jgi:hypothetical protein
VLFNNNKTTLVAYPAGRQGAYTVPAGVTAIGDYAFFRCRGLTGITLPASVTSIGVAAFAMCSGLTGVTVPGSVTSIGDSAFEGCSGLNDTRG